MRKEISRSLIKMYKEEYWHFILISPLKWKLIKSLEKRVIRMRRNNDKQIMTVFITDVELSDEEPPNIIQICFKWLEHDHFQSEIAEDSSVLNYLQVQYFSEIDEMLLKLEYDL